MKNVIKQIKTQLKRINGILIKPRADAVRENQEKERERENTVNKLHCQLNNKLCLPKICAQCIALFLGS